MYNSHTKVTHTRVDGVGEADESHLVALARYHTEVPRRWRGVHAAVDATASQLVPLPGAPLDAARRSTRGASRRSSLLLELREFPGQGPVGHVVL